MLLWVLCAVLAAAVLALLFRLRLLRRGLDEITAQLSKRLEEDTNNPIFLSTRDRSARKLASELNVQLKALRQARLRYESGDRELQEAVTNVSHDLRTPLTALFGYLELLEREELSPAGRRYLGFITGRAKAMEQLTEELLRCSVALTAREELHLEPVDLNRALEESIAAYYAALTARGIVPEVTIPEQRVVRRLDRSALSRVLGNLMSNALKHSGGDLRVELTAGGTIILANSAGGLDEVQAGRLFDRFFTVENAQNSTGLGLSIARTLTERMGGSVQARWRDGQLEIILDFPQQEE